MVILVAARNARRATCGGQGYEGQHNVKELQVASCSMLEPQLVELFHDDSPFLVLVDSSLSDNTHQTTHQNPHCNLPILRLHKHYKVSEETCWFAVAWK